MVLIGRIVEFVSQSQRVMKIARKPDQKEFMNMFRIVSIAAFVIGLIGFIISMAFSLFG
ncbi:MAG: protein translocase SEC61 complex subunit gamma [Candidatus Micrarchaeia archaeon]